MNRDDIERLVHLEDKVDVLTEKTDRILKQLEEQVTLSSIIKNKWVLSFGLVIFANSTGMGIKGAIDLIKVIFT